MGRIDEIEPVYVDFVPRAEELEPGKIYISDAQKLATHLCACGCGAVAATPIRDGFWWHMKDAGGKLILRPSVCMPCGSCYNITHNRIEWLTEEEARECDGQDIGDII